MRNLFLGLLGLFVSLGVATACETTASAGEAGHSPPPAQASFAGEICNQAQGVSANTLNVGAALPARRFIWEASNPWEEFEVFPYLPPGYRCYKGDRQLSWSAFWHWGGWHGLVKRWLKLQRRIKERMERQVKALQQLQDASRTAPRAAPASPLRKRLPVIVASPVSYTHLRAHET